MDAFVNPLSFLDFLKKLRMTLAIRMSLIIFVRHRTLSKTISDIDGFLVKLSYEGFHVKLSYESI